MAPQQCCFLTMYQKTTLFAKTTYLTTIYFGGNEVDSILSLCVEKISILLPNIYCIFFQNYVSCRWVRAGIFRLKRARAMKVLSRAELGHFNFWAETELMIFFLYIAFLLIFFLSWFYQFLHQSFKKYIIHYRKKIPSLLIMQEK